MKKPLKIGLALVIGASVLGIFSDPEPSENRTYEEQQVEEQTPEKDWHEQVLKSLEKKEETEILDYDQCKCRDEQCTVTEFAVHHVGEAGVGTPKATA